LENGGIAQPRAADNKAAQLDRSWYTCYKSNRDPAVGFIAINADSSIPIGLASHAVFSYSGNPQWLKSARLE
jgi:hypothetical protein